MRCLLSLLAILALPGALSAGPATRTSDLPTTQPATQPAERRSSIDASIRDGVKFIVGSQNKDGSWGTGRETRGFEVMASVPGSLKSFQVATTALCVMALREVNAAGDYPGAREAHRKGLEFLVNNADIRRDDGALLYNTWAHTYGLQCLAIEMRHSNDPRIKKAAELHIRRLSGYETVMGGWNYYDFVAQTQTPSMGPTSFGTSAALVALFEAKESGLEIPKNMVEKSVKRLAEMKLPNNAFLYSADLKYRPRMAANLPKGSVGRTQSGNYALWIWNAANLNAKAAGESLEFFIKDHDYIQMGQKRQYPHESWYQTAPYYYYFGHYYAARLIEKMGPEGKKAYGAKLADIGILPYQLKDGSWWDFAMWDFHKPYGTAFAVMTLLRCE
ncbi:hypothetical protein [Humisphaera borealis]|uniref:Squalene cyclase C-terminal domain-containing protein n=1 Tax=Humisphaera borealis TaxID=2807512 RepID=A0A7M2WW82_9BACT|nr:hypothetical protein [Humisphaera borealis]QOV89726.1 hypothetical protein IPV69_26670 [Humisphaera borealis]